MIPWTAKAPVFRIRILFICGPGPAQNLNADPDPGCISNGDPDPGLSVIRLGDNKNEQMIRKSPGS
jgi:hypothetical protein